MVTDFIRRKNLYSMRFENKNYGPGNGLNGNEFYKQS